jgi:hypothetical protein
VLERELIRQRNEVRGWECDELGQRAVAIEAEDLPTRTDIRASAPAVAAIAADDDRIDEDPVAHRDPVDPFPDLPDSPGRLVTERERARGGDRPVEDMKVGAAEPAGCHLDQALPEPWFRDRNVLEPKP